MNKVFVLPVSEEALVVFHSVYAEFRQHFCKFPWLLSISDTAEDLIVLLF